MLDVNGYIETLNAKANEQHALGTFINMYETFKSFFVYERLDDDRKNVIDRHITIEFDDELDSSNFVLMLRLATFLALLDDGCIPFFRHYTWEYDYTLCRTIKPINLISGEIVFVKPKEIIQSEPDKSTKDEHGYPLDKNHICFPTGHAISVLFELDNGSSKTVNRRCTRCGYEETDQYDYN